MSTSSGCEVAIAAASDLSPLQDAFVKALPGCKVRLTFGSSGVLARQIASGAPFDVFLSASAKFAHDLVGEEKADSPTPYARGRIALWSKEGLRKLADARTVTIANPQFAPYGMAARQFLERSGQWASAEKRIVFAENVRQTVQFAETGNADLAVTSWTLVRDKGGILIDEKWHEPIAQVAVLPKLALNRNGGRSFLAWLTGPEGRRLLQSHGFGLP